MLTVEPDAGEIVRLMQTGMTYEAVAAACGTSRGKVWRIATEHGVRKNEARIEARRRDRDAQMRANLAELLGQTMQADVLDVLSGLPDESVQLVVTSPPYNIGRGYDDDASRDLMLPLRYFGWLCSIVAELERVLRPGGVIAMVVGATRDRHGVLKPIDYLLDEAFSKTALTFQNRIAWLLQHGLTPKRRLANRHETILIYAKGKPTFNPNVARTPSIQFDKRAFKGPNKGRASGNPFGKWPSDVWEVKHLGHNHPEKTRHPAAFPVAIPKRCILLYSMPGDLVMDVFHGSGSTQVAAIETGRAFIGCDTAAYADIRPERIAAAQPDTFFPFPGVTPESLAFWQDEVRSWKSPVNLIRRSATPAIDDEQLAMDFVRDELMPSARCA
jgi:DNA modification methylase